MDKEGIVSFASERIFKLVQKIIAND